MARAGKEEDVFFSACLSPTDCYVLMAPISPETAEVPPTESEEPQVSRPIPAERYRRRPVSRSTVRLSNRRSRVASPQADVLTTHVESTYDSVNVETESQYDTPPRLQVPETKRVVESIYENLAVRRPPNIIPRINQPTNPVRTQPVSPQPALPIRSRGTEPRTPETSPDKRFSKLITKNIQQELDNVIPQRLDPSSRNQPKFLNPNNAVHQPVPRIDSDPVIPDFKKTCAIDFDARIYRCNELPKSTIGKQTLISGEENFACAYVNHLGGYLRLMRPQATLFIPPHAILGDPEPVVLYLMSKTNQVGYTPLVSCLQPDQFLVSPIMYVGKPGSKYSTVDVVLSFPVDDSQGDAAFFSVLTVKTFDNTSLLPENAKWRVLAPGHDYFFTVCGGRGVLMVSQSAFYVIRATKSVPEYQNMAIPRDASTRKIRVALFGRSYSESNRAKLHVVFCKDCDREVERVIQSEGKESFRKLDHVRALSIQTSSGQPIWVSFCQMKNTSWCLQTSDTAKFTPDQLFNYADQYPPSVTFALSNSSHNLLSPEAFVQCMVVVHEGNTVDYQAEGVTSFVHLVGDITVSKSGQFQSQSLGRASGKRLPVLPVPPSVAWSHGQSTSALSSHPSLSPQSSQTPSDCPSSSPPPVPGDRTSVLLLNSYDSHSDTAKARFEEFYISYQALAEVCLLLQASKTEGNEKDWVTFASKIGLSTQQVDRLSDRYTFQSPLAIIHLFFGTNQSATSCCPSTSPREKARAVLARLLSIFQEMKRDELIRVVRRELTRIDQQIERSSKFLFEGGQFEIRTSVGMVGGAIATSHGHPRHSFSDGDVTVVTSSTGAIKGRLNDIVNWFKTKSSDVFKLPSSSKETTVEQVYEVPQPNFSVFNDQNTYEALMPLKRGKGSDSDKRKDNTKQNDYI